MESNSFNNINLKDCWEIILGLGTMAVVPARWVWGLGGRVKDLEAAHEADQKAFETWKQDIKESNALFQSQAVKVLERLEESVNRKLVRTDDSLTTQLQAMAEVKACVSAMDERTRIDSERLSRIEDKCLGSQCLPGDPAA